jgi:Rrf2 family transcriptional regulator, iron-sulfur cluster assembly transcription factor
MFSNSTKYAIRAIVHMLNDKGNEKNTVVDMAAELSIPRPYLSKVLQQLSKSRIISSTKGRGGGFYLSEENLYRPLIDVIICIEGHNVFNKCILGLQECSDSDPCILHHHFNSFKMSIEKSICEQSIKDLLKLSAQAS